MTKSFPLYTFTFLLLFCTTAQGDWFPGISERMAEFDENVHLILSMRGEYDCNFDITVPGIEITETYNGYQLKLEGMNSVGGGPVLCGYLNMPGQSDVSAEIIHLETAEYSIDTSILNLTEVPGGGDDLEFESGTIFIGEPLILRDVRIVPVSIRPYRIDYLTNTIHVTREISIDFRFLSGNSVNPKQHFTSRISPAFKKLYREMIWNYTDDGTDDFEPSNYMIICPDNLAGNLQNLYQWKNQKGVRTRLVTFSEIGTNLEDYIIKDFITFEYYNSEYPPDYVLLVGDENNSPAHTEYTSDPPTPFSYVSYPGNYINDNYFACLEGDDYFPDIFFGRMCVNSTVNAQIIVNKIISYEKNPNTAQLDWYQRGIVCSDIAEPSQRLTKLEVRETMLGEGGYTSVDTLFGAEQPSLFINWATNGRSFINYRGTGWDFGWSGINIMVDDIPSILNYYKLSVVTGIGCGVSGFGNYYACFGEAWMNAGTISNPTGAVAFLGPTWNTHTQFNDCLDIGLYDALFKDSLRTLAPAYVAGKMAVEAQFDPYIQAYPAVEEVVYTLFGQYLLFSDPELSTRAAPPREIQVTHTDSVLLGEGLVNVNVTDNGGNPLEGLKVGAFIDGETFDADLTGSNGSALLQVSPQSRPNYLHITVTGLDIDTYSDSIPVYSNSQFVSISDYQLEDIPGGDGILAPGESGELSLAGTNYGIEPAGGVWAIMSTENEGVEIQTDSIYFGDIAPEEEVWGDAVFEFDISPQYEPHNVVFSLTFHDDEGYNWISELDFVVSHPYVIMNSYNVDPGPDGILERGGEADMTVTVHNIGGVPVVNLTGVVESLDPEISMINPIADYGTLISGQIVANNSDPFIFRVNNNCPNNFAAHFRFTLSGDQGSFVYILEEEFEILVSQPMSDDPSVDSAGIYFAYEAKDYDYLNAPVYEWMEISPQEGGDGTPIEFTAEDQMQTIALPFTFIYYGEEFDNITVSADGYIVPGVSEITIPVNWTIPRYDEAVGMIAPMWDDLYCLVYEPGDVSYLYDPVEGAFRIEYHEFTHGNTNVYAETFQVVIYDPDVHVTQSGYSEIEFIYGNISDFGRLFSSCGMENLQQDDGIQMWFNYEISPSSFEPEAFTAILITTEPPDFVSIKDPGAMTLYIPETVFLSDNYPNPFNPTTSFRFGLPKDGMVELSVYNILGRKVASLVNEYMSAGLHQIQWNANEMSSGIYFARLSSGGEVRTVKCLLVK